MTTWQQQFLDQPSNMVIVFGSTPERQHSIREFVEGMRHHTDWLVQPMLDLTRSIYHLRALRTDRSARFDLHGYIVTQNPRAIPINRPARVVITSQAAAFGRPVDLSSWYEFIGWKA